MRKVMVMVAVLLCGATVFANDGRWKSDGNGGCYWDEFDGGPDQCDPNAAFAAGGRWKVGGDGSCYWDGNDGGPNQCEPGSTGNVTEEEANRLATATQTMIAWGVNPNNVQVKDLPVILRALEDQGYSFSVPSWEAYGVILDYQGTAAETCAVMLGKAQKLEAMSRAFTEVSWLYASGGGLMRVLNANPATLSALVVGAAVSSIASTAASWLANSYRNAPCLA